MISSQDHEAIRYLEFCVQVLGVKDQAIHNYLVALYAQLQPEQLLKYLNIQGTVSGGDVGVWVVWMMVILVGLC